MSKNEHPTDNYLGDEQETITSNQSYVEFLSRGLAHLAHDMKNHLATINESAGLIGDLLRLEQRRQVRWHRRIFRRRPDPGLNIAPFFEELNGIQEDVARGAGLVQELGALAHGMAEDLPPSRVDDGSTERPGNNP